MFVKLFEFWQLPRNLVFGKVVRYPYQSIKCFFLLPSASSELKFLQYVFHLIRIIEKFRIKL